MSDWVCRSCGGTYYIRVNGQCPKCTTGKAADVPTEPKAVCETCDDSGWFWSDPVNERGHRVKVRCQCSTTAARQEETVEVAACKQLNEATREAERYRLLHKNRDLIDANDQLRAEITTLHATLEEREKALQQATWTLQYFEHDDHLSSLKTGIIPRGVAEYAAWLRKRGAEN